MLAKIENGKVTEYPVTPYELRKKNPNTSFPRDFNTADLSGFGYVSVVETLPPSYNDATEVVTEGTPALVNSVWTQRWEKTNLSQAEIDRKATEEREANELSVRTERDNKLQVTDYLALSDATLTDAMKTYRQALRDVPAQSGFPDNITWPTKPS